MKDDLVQGQPPATEDLRWLALMDAARQGSLSALEDAAKQLIGLDGLISGIYFGAITLSQLPAGSLNETSRWLFFAPVALWLASLVAAVLALVPSAHQYNPHLPEDARRVYTALVRQKDDRLKIALWLFVGSVLALAVALWQFLGILIHSGPLP